MTRDGIGALARLEVPAFRPARGFAGPHRQTILANVGPRPSPLASRTLEVESEPGTRIRLELDAPADGLAVRGGLVLVHGLTGDANSPYLVRSARLAVARGLAVARVNLRNCGGTEELARGSYHGGVDADARAAVAALRAELGVDAVVLAGFSIGGNVVLRSGIAPPPGARGIVAVSPAVDFARATQAIASGRRNALYQRLFVRDLGRILMRRRALGLVEFEDAELARITTVRGLDERFTAPLGGFRDLDDYYARASSLRMLPELQLPALVLASSDDPLVPFESFEQPEVADNPRIRLVATAHGGHQGFLGRGLERRWAERRLVDAALALLGTT